MNWSRSSKTLAAARISMTSVTPSIGGISWSSWPFPVSGIIVRLFLCRLFHWPRPIAHAVALADRRHPQRIVAIQEDLPVDRAASPDADHEHRQHIAGLRDVAHVCVFQSQLCRRPPSIDVRSEEHTSELQ